MSDIDKAINDLRLRDSTDPFPVKMRVRIFARRLERYANDRGNVALRREIERQIDELESLIDSEVQTLKEVGHRGGNGA